MRFFDPRWVGTWEQEAWAAYYRRQWLKVLVASVGLVRCGFRMNWARTLKGAYFVLRANQLWAPSDNDPDGARGYMQQFYSLVAEAYGVEVDTAEAARLEVEWWRAHREAQHSNRPYSSVMQNELARAIADLYAFVYECEPSEVKPAAQLRADAMAMSDRWVEEGCDPASPLLKQERALLIRSYALLLAAIHR